MRSVAMMALCTIFLIVLLGSVTTETKARASDSIQYNLDVGFKNKEPKEANDDYSHLAAISGGSVIGSNKTDIAHASSITVAEAALAFPVIVMVTHVDALTTRDVTFSVDATLTVILVEVIGQIHKKNIILLDPTGRTIPADGGTLAVDSAGALVYKIKSPLSGTWQLRFPDYREYDVIVKGSSQVSFQHSFLQQKPGIPFPFEITGDPPAGKNLTAKIEVNAIDKTQNITYVTLFALNGDVIKTTSLTQLSRRDANIYKAVVSLPAHVVRIGITGLDNNGTAITRVSRTAVSPESQITVTFNKTQGFPDTTSAVHLYFTVYNKGEAGNMTAEVTADTGSLKASLSPAVFYVQQNHTYTGSVTVTSLSSTRSTAGNILLTITGPSGISQFDSTLVSILPATDSTLKSTESSPNSGTVRASSGVSGLVISYLSGLVISYLTVMLVV